MKIKKRYTFTLVEILVCMALLVTLSSTFTYMGYDALKEYRKRNGRAGFKEYIVSLHHKNALKENNLMLLVHQHGNYLETTLGGNIKGIKARKGKKKYYVGKFFEEGATFAIKITPQAIPKDNMLASWIQKNSCLYKFYTD